MKLGAQSRSSSQERIDLESSRRLDDAHQTPASGGETEVSGQVRLPTARESDESWYFGAKVFDPVPGVHENVVYPDLASLYPNMMRTLNLGFLTMVGDEQSVEMSPYSLDECLWAYVDTRPVARVQNDEDWTQYRDPEQYKAVRQRDKKGNWQLRWNHEPRWDKWYYLKPSVYQGDVAAGVDGALDFKEIYRGTDQYEAAKRVVNSVYGYVSFSTDYNESRYYHRRLSESITLCGRKVITYTAEALQERLRDEYGVDTTLVGGDTDSAMLAFPADMSRDRTIELATQAAEHLNESGYDTFMCDEFGCDEHWMEVEIESYSPRAYMHDAKKRYATHVTWDEGDEVDQLNVKGFEMMRSDVSDVTVTVQECLFELLLRMGPESAKQPYYDMLSDLVERIKSGEYPLEHLGVRGGIRKPLSEYGSTNRRPQPIYRGSRFAKQNLDGEEDIGEASKPLCYPVSVRGSDLPHTYSSDTAEDGDVVDYIAVENPSNLDRPDIIIDYDEIVEKQVKDRVTPIFGNLHNWSWTGAVKGHEEGDLSQYF